MQLFTVFGVKVRLSPYFLGLLALYAGIGVWFEAVIVFGLVFVHEWVHILTAKGYGVEVESVELLPFGGVARLKGMFETDPVVETVVAVVGPASNLLLAIMGIIIGGTGWINGDITEYFIKANFAVAAFNLLPALPLDGGRVLRAWLSTRIGFRDSTKYAAYAGKIIGVCLFVGGAISMVLRYSDFTLCLIGVFLFLAARTEEKEAQFVFLRYLRNKQQELAESGVLPAYNLAVKPDYPVKAVIRQFLPRRFTIVQVVDDDFHLGPSFSETQIIRAMFERGINLPVGEVESL